ncbi:8-oxo-dGTP diphosphatase MutT [Limnobaculum parvum]|uniref:8-oxo-dGTP diphosphatase n=1 Tax=Limnobaculum parvum TaxID=2172103 RepID=A0A2Y9TWI7_9GAMM|nr:8-oxo-dGTP diphosphatase MutT [Limnobaculum parvum]AWH88077.1 8-oxo-dGTP diphosphatase MutT [Limnobaculum parvum]
MKRIEIAVGIIINSEQAIFVTQRLKGSHLAGYWEFPGGKVESGEDARQALKRELYEEVGIEMIHSIPLKTLEYDYPDRQLTLHFFIVDGWEGQPEGREGQVSRWIDVSKLNVAEFPEANQPVIVELKQRYRIE